MNIAVNTLKKREFRVAQIAFIIQNHAHQLSAIRRRGCNSRKKF